MNEVYTSESSDNEEFNVEQKEFKEEEGIILSKNEKPVQQLLFQNEMERQISYFQNYTNKQVELQIFGKLQVVQNQQKFLIQPLNNSILLNLDSLLFLRQGQCLGQISDVFGPIDNPIYVVQQDTLSSEWVKSGLLENNIEVYFSINQVKVIGNQELISLKKMKGTDASNKFDEELPIQEQEISDDEFENRIAKRKNLNYQLKNFQRFYLISMQNVPLK